MIRRTEGKTVWAGIPAQPISAAAVCQDHEFGIVLDHVVAKYLRGFDTVATVSRGIR